MKTAIVVIDMQNDFVTGSLGTREAAEVLPRIRDFLAENAASSSPADVFFTQDTHPENYLETQEGRRLPVPHCIRGSRGWDICEELKPFASADRTIQKPTFGSLELGSRLKTYDRIIFTGVCTDICVISNALIAKAAAPETSIEVKPELCAGTTPENHENALKALRICQIDA